MDRDRVGAALAVVLGLLVLATAAGGLAGSEAAEAEDAAPGGLGIGEGEGSGVGEGNGTGIELREENATAGTSGNLMADFLATLLRASLVFGVVFLVVTLVRDGLEGLRALLASLLGDLLGLAVALAVVALLLAFLSMVVGDGGGGFVGGSAWSSFTDEGGEAANTSPVPVPPAVLAVVFVVLVGVALVLGRDGGESSSLGAAGALSAVRPSNAETTGGDAGGGLAVDDVPATNEVYRAWRELATRTETADLRTDTPGEVARRAVEAGLDRDAVRTVTDLFAEVRYGGRPADPERERSAAAAIEDVDGGDDEP